MSTIATTGNARSTDPAAIRRAALVGGFGLLALAVLAGVANFVVLERLVTEGDAASTTRDILASRGLFQLGIACFAGAVLTDLVVAWALWVFFAPVDSRLSAITAWCRVVYAVAFGIAVTSLASAANALGTGSNPSGPVQREAMADITRFQDIWGLSLGLFGVHLLLIGWLAFRSNYVPRWIGALVAISGAGYVIDTIGGLFSGYSLEVGAVTFVGEVVLMIWLLVRGRSVQAARSNS